VSRSGIPPSTPAFSHVPGGGKRSGGMIGVDSTVTVASALSLPASFVHVIVNTVSSPSVTLVDESLATSPTSLSIVHVGAGEAALA
jgi:hypothetical protein